jgi:hypothetical protein
MHEFLIEYMHDFVIEYMHEFLVLCKYRITCLDVFISVDDHRQPTLYIVYLFGFSNKFFAE